MPGSKTSNEPEHCKSPRISAEDSEDESEILEESPCGRWLKRREEVDQRDVPGIDFAYLAMDTEEGVEVVWNEVQFSERKNFKAQEEKLRQVFDNLTQLEHPNIVKFHKYWTDNTSDKPRIIFITEYMSSGSLKQFLKKTKKNMKKLPIQGWKRWCSQILSGLDYLHSCTPSIIHGNLTCDTIFIQHNGLVKIGSVAPDAIHHHVKTCRENVKNMHFIAPEYGTSVITPLADIYSFGVCALEMAALEILGNGESGTMVTEDNISKTIDMIEDPLQKNLIRQCLRTHPLERPTAKDLLFHPILYEVNSLKVLSAHVVLKQSKYLPENWTEEAILSHYGSDTVVAEIDHGDERPGVQMKMSNVQVLEKLEKFMEDVRNGQYPVVPCLVPPPPPPGPRAISPEVAESVKSETPEPLDVETRKVLTMMCSLKPLEDKPGLWMTLLLRMDDKMNRQLSCEVGDQDTSLSLADELVHYGFINELDREKVSFFIEEALRSQLATNGSRQPQVVIGQPMPSHQYIPQPLLHHPPTYPGHPPPVQPAVTQFQVIPVNMQNLGHV